MKRILVGLDASERSRAVLAAAVALAEGTKSKLLIVRAVGVPFEVPVEAYRMSPRSLAEVLQQDAHHDLESMARELVPPTVDSAVRVGVGTPWQVVCEAARELDADLIVIGSHGYTALDRVIGTTAARIVNHADRSVLVVRAPFLLGATEPATKAKESEK